MPRVIACVSCGLTGHVPEGFSEPQAPCPRCGTLVAIPATGADGVAPAEGVLATLAADPQPLDTLFAQLAAPVQLAPAEGHPNAAAVPVAPATSATSLPAVMDPQAEREWLQEERQRLDSYLAKHFELLKQQREELAAWRTQVEASLLVREQEVNRLQKHLAWQQAKQARHEQNQPAPEKNDLPAANQELQVLQGHLAQLHNSAVSFMIAG